MTMQMKKQKAAVGASIVAAMLQEGGGGRFGRNYCKYFQCQVQEWGPGIVEGKWAESVTEERRPNFFGQISANIYHFNFIQSVQPGCKRAHKTRPYKGTISGSGWFPG